MKLQAIQNVFLANDRRDRRKKERRGGLKLLKMMIYVVILRCLGFFCLLIPPFLPNRVDTACFCVLI